MKAKKKLLGEELNCVEHARSHFYLGAISIEASKVTLALDTLNAGMDILSNVFQATEEGEMIVNADIAAMTGTLGYAKLLFAEVKSAKSKAYIYFVLCRRHHPQFQTYITIYNVCLMIFNISAFGEGRQNVFHFVWRLPKAKECSGNPFTVSPSIFDRGSTFRKN